MILFYSVQMPDSMRIRILPFQKRLDPRIWIPRLRKICKIVFDYFNKWIRIEQINLMRIHDPQPWFSNRSEMDVLWANPWKRKGKEKNTALFCLRWNWLQPPPSFLLFCLCLLSVWQKTSLVGLLLLFIILVSMGKALKSHRFPLV